MKVSNGDPLTVQMPGSSDRIECIVYKAEPRENGRLAVYATKMSGSDEGFALAFMLPDFIEAGGVVEHGWRAAQAPGG